MRVKGKLVVALLSIAATFVFASMVVAGPIPAVLVSGSQGESDLATDGKASNNTATLNVDWIVGNTADAAFAGWVGVVGVNGVAVMPGDWIYLYQAENTNAVVGTQMVDVDGDLTPDTVTGGITMSTYTVGPSGPVRTGGDLGKSPAFATNKDLDVAFAGRYPAHVVNGTTIDADDPTEPEPPGGDEEEGDCPMPDTFGPGGTHDNGTPEDFCFNPFPATGGSSTFLFVDGATWIFFKPPFHESNVLWIASPQPPVYGIGAALSTGETWRSGSTNDLGFTGQMVPIPAGIPEPTVVTLFGVGLLGALAARWAGRRKRD
jgi:hypothetical protein